MLGINFKDNNKKPRGRRSAPKNGERRADRQGQYAYTFEDPSVGKLQVLNSDRAWWLEKVKLGKLVDAYKFYATDDQACFYAGITTTQLQYFQELHPEFYRIKHAAKQDPSLRAKRTIVGSLEKDKDTAKWWLERTEKDNFSPRVENTGREGRDLYDGLAQDIRELGETLRNNPNDGAKNDKQEHAGNENTGDPNAGQDGHRNETAPTGNDVGGPGIPPKAS